jgi:hypothetical protein
MNTDPATLRPMNTETAALKAASILPRVILAETAQHR